MRIRMALAVALVLSVGFASCATTTPPGTHVPEEKVAVPAGDAYLCVADRITGFAYDNYKKAWHQADFGREKWVVKKRNDDVHPWEVKKFDEESGPATSLCKGGFDDNGTLSCSGVEEFRMNNQTMRFTSAYLVGYSTVGIKGSKYKEDENTPFIAIGNCSNMISGKNK